MSGDRLVRLLSAVLLAAALGVACGCREAEPAVDAGRGTTGPRSATDTAPEAPADAPVRARRVILVIGDGMGFEHVAAGSLYRYGVAGRTALDELPVRRAVSTYPEGGGYSPAAVRAEFSAVLSGATDSAAAATALATGHKVANGRISMDARGRALETLVEVAESTGRSTGLVTDVPVSHATPAAFAAHQPGRTSYEVIAAEMLADSGLDVLMGAGHPYYDDRGRRRRPDFEYVGGPKVWERLGDGSLGGDADGDGDSDRWTRISAKERFEAVANGTEAPTRLCGIAEAGQTLQQRRPGGTGVPFQAAPNAAVPPLSTMAVGALSVLDSDPDGFFAMVECGAIDWASHENQKGRLIEAQLALEDTVRAVCAWVEVNGGWDETLVVVTADHETGYLTGPRSGQGGGVALRRPVTSRGRGTVPSMVFHTTGHTNSLVPLYAKGAGATGFAEAASRADDGRGHYLDNTDVHGVIEALLR